MHGTFGGDGELNGIIADGTMCRLSDAICSLPAMAMDKAITKQVLAAENIPIITVCLVHRIRMGKKKSGMTDIEIKKLKWPLFIKPVHLGSSIAITKLNKIKLENAIGVAFHYDDKVLAESVENLVEVTLPIIRK